MFSLSKQKAVFCVPENIETAVINFQKSLELIGSFKAKHDESDGSITLEGKSMYGLQRVPLTITLTKKTQGETSILVIGRSDDVKGVGSKRCMERMMKAHAAISTNDHVQIAALSGKDGFTGFTGLTKQKLFLTIVLFLVVMMVVVFWLSTIIYL